MCRQQQQQQLDAGPEPSEKNRRRRLVRKMLKNRELLVSFTTAEVPSNTGTRLGQDSKALAVNPTCKWTPRGERSEEGAGSRVVWLVSIPERSCAAPGAAAGAANVSFAQPLTRLLPGGRTAALLGELLVGWKSHSGASLPPSRLFFYLVVSR